MQRKPHSDKTKRKLSIAHKKSLLAIAARKKLHTAQLGRSRDKKTLKKMERTQFKKGQIPWNKGRLTTKEERGHLSTIMKGRKHKPETIEKMKLAHKGKKYTLGFHPTIETRKKLSDAHRGEKHYNWKGGITQENLVIRRSLEMRLWREAVFKRDHYTCVQCKARGQKGKIVILNADHIKPFSLYPSLRFSIENGRTLCVPCHKKTPTYGNKKLYVQA